MSEMKRKLAHVVRVSDTTIWAIGDDETVWEMNTYDRLRKWRYLGTVELPQNSVEELEANPLI